MASIRKDKLHAVRRRRKWYQSCNLDLVIAQNSTIRSLFLEGPAGRLEALLNAGAENATHAAVVCHPHPLFGGTLHNKVVFHTMKALNSFGFPVLRFNFRGTGLSQGEHDQGRGEIDDVRTALDWLDASFTCLWYSRDFLSARRLVCGRRAPRCAVKALIGVGTPVGPVAADAETPRTYTFDFLRGLCEAEVVCQRSARPVWSASEAGGAGRFGCRSRRSWL